MLKDDCDYKLSVLRGKQIRTYNQFEPGLNRSISVTKSIDSGGILEFSCCIGSALASTVYPKKISSPSGIPQKYLLIEHILKHYFN